MVAVEEIVASELLILQVGLEIVILVKLLQSNAKTPMLVTLSGRVMLVNPSQLPNASCPILVTLSGMMILVNEP